MGEVKDKWGLKWSSPNDGEGVARFNFHTIMYKLQCYFV